MKKNDEELLNYEIPKFDDETRVSAEINSRAKTSQIKQALNIEKKHSLFGFIITLVLIVSGIISFFLGITGVVNLSAELDGFKLKLLNCSPGVLIIIVGLGFYWLSKPKITIK